MPKARLDHNKGLPKCWQFTHGAYYYRVPVKDRALWGGRTHARLGATLAEATEFFSPRKQLTDAGVSVDEIVGRTVSGGVVFRAALWKHIGYRPACGVPLPLLQSLYTSSRASAAARGLSFSLHPKHLIDLADKAEGQCMVTGIKWDFRKTSANGKRPWVPSVDRIDSAHGYEPVNCRLICAAANIALSDFGDAVLAEIARGMIRSRFCDTGTNFAL